jgi:hypothetical protein
MLNKDQAKAEITALKGVLDQYVANTVAFEVAQRAVIKVARFWILGALLLGILLGVLVDSSFHHVRFR